MSANLVSPDVKDEDEIFLEPTEEQLHAKFKDDFIHIVLDNIGKIGTSKVYCMFVSIAFVYDKGVRDCLVRAHTYDTFEKE